MPESFKGLRPESEPTEELVPEKGVKSELHPEDGVVPEKEVPLENPPEETDAEKSALLKEIERLRNKNRGESQEDRALQPIAAEDTPDVHASRAEAALYNSWQQECLDEFLLEHPEYSTNSSAWSRFLSEWNDRVSLLEAAKRDGKPITKKFIKGRLDSVRRSVMDTSSIVEEAKRELLKTSSQADVAKSGMASGDREGGEEVKPQKKKILNWGKKTGFDAWAEDYSSR